MSESQESQSRCQCLWNVIRKQVVSLLTIGLLLFCILYYFKHGIPGLTGPEPVVDNPIKAVTTSRPTTPDRRHPKDVSVTPSPLDLSGMDSLFEQINVLEKYVGSNPIQRPSDFFNLTSAARP
jgi:hypothetical protein